MLALIDGDALIYSAGFAVEASEPPHHAFKIIKNILERILLETKCDDYKIYLGSKDKSNFRYAIAKTKPYKESRVDKPRPNHEMEIRAYLFEHHSAIEVQGIETDDALGIEQCNDVYATESDGLSGAHLDFTCDTIICTNDKDLDMIPGWHYDLDFGKSRKKNGGGSYKLKAYKNKGTYFITDPGFISLRKNSENGKQVLCGGGYLWFCCQLLLGDSTDNIPNLARGYGPKKVYEILKDCKTKKEGIQAVWTAYKKELGDSLTVEQLTARLIEVAQLVWIKRKKTNETIFLRNWLEDSI
jgi:5'-3' exonuclease